MNRFCLITTGLLALLSSPCLGADPVKSVPKLYPYCIELDVPGIKPRSIPEQAKLIRELGYDGGGYQIWLDDSLETNLKTFDKEGLQVYLLWAYLNLNPKRGPVYDPRLPGAIRKLKGRPTTVAVLLQGLKPGDPKGMEPAIKAIRELAVAAAEAGVRVSIYHHWANWTESLPFVLEVVRKVDRPEVGYTFNVCHWLKIEGDRDYRPLLRQNAAKLFGVSTCGAQIGAQDWANGLVQPLDKGNFDNRALLATLGEIGYQGPIALMCYAIPGDAREHLARSMKTWRRLNGLPDER